MGRRGGAGAGHRLVRRHRRRPGPRPSCWLPSRRSSGSTRSTGWSGSTTARPVRSFSCKRFCNASSTAAAASSGSMAWAAAAPISSSSGRRATGPAGSSSNARCSTRAWSEPSRRGSSRRRDTWDRCAAEAGHLVIFDRDEARSWDEKVFCRRESANGVEVLVWGDVMPRHHAATGVGGLEGAPEGENGYLPTRRLRPESRVGCSPSSGPADMLGRRIRTDTP